jgi:phosphatidylinositol-3-phosphatase
MRALLSALIIVTAGCGVPAAEDLDAGADAPIGGGTASGADQADASAPLDASVPFDAGVPDAGFPDAGLPDAGVRDAGIDAGRPFMGITTVFVIAMENKTEQAIYGNPDASYINDTLMQQYAYATDYTDVLTALIPSEPHYVWLEAGTNSFSDWTFLLDSDPSGTNSTNNGSHLVAQLANTNKTWRSYQEGLDTMTGACPINSSGFYAAKHDPFVFFTDVTGNPPSKTNASCAAHHRPFSAFAADLAAGDVATYTFITPNLCNDMHGASGCMNGCNSTTADLCIPAGDAWLAANVPPIINYVNQHDGVLFIVWDEPEGTVNTQPFIVVGPHVKRHYGSTLNYTHSSYLKTLEKILKVPVNSRVSSATDFADFFQPMFYP